MTFVLQEGREGGVAVAGEWNSTRLHAAGPVGTGVVQEGSCPGLGVDF